MEKAINDMINYGIDANTAKMIYDTRYSLWDESGRHGKMVITRDDLIYFGSVTPPNGFKTIKVD